ncbi:MAG: ABC transporter ATP-binding protein [Bryobacteraceae bacterium]
MRLRIVNLSLTFPAPGGPVHALRGVSFETREREFLSLVGPSGCGKTTLLRLVAGLQAPTEGEVQRIPSAADRNPQVLLVSQERNLFPWMTVLDNAAFGLEMQGVPLRQRRQRARALLARLGFEDREQAWPHELSLGMKQRVAVARCFLSDPAVMLMDEPFAALDCQRRMELQQELLKLWEESHKTVLFVTHDIEEAILLGDRVLVFSRQPGRVVAEFPIPFRRPRQTEITMTDEFLELKRRVAAALGLILHKEAGVL